LPPRRHLSWRSCLRAESSTMRTVASENESQGARGPGRPGARAAAIRKSRLRGMGLERLEPRTLLAGLPAATGTAPLQVSRNPGNDSKPSIEIDPRNPLDQVAVWTRSTTNANDNLNNGQTTVFTEAAFSTNGGASWSALGGTLGNSRLDFNQAQNNGA